MSTNIISAAKSAAEWLAGIVRKDNKLNPIPYPLFKSCLDKRIEWALKDSVILDPERLEKLIKEELATVGIHVSPNKYKKAQPLPAQKQDSSAPSKDWSYLLQADNVNSTVQLFKWMYSVLDNAAASHTKSIRFSAQFDWRIDF